MVRNTGLKNFEGKIIKEGTRLIIEPENIILKVKFGWYNDFNKGYGFYTKSKYGEGGFDKSLLKLRILD